MMVWGMRLPVTFGEFWPEGDFEYDDTKAGSGYRDRLRLHYLAQSSEEQLRLYDYRGFDHGGNGVGYGAGSYPSFVSRKFSREMGTKDGPDSLPLTPVNDHEAPLTFDIEKTPKALGSLVMLNNHVLAVDEDLKGIIERLEPSTYKFFPMEFRISKGKVYGKKYFTLIILQYFDSYSPNYSDESKKSMTGRVFRTESFGAAHLWRDRRFPLVNCLSEELKSEINWAGLRIPKNYQMKEC